MMKSKTRADQTMFKEFMREKLSFSRSQWAIVDLPRAAATLCRDARDGTLPLLASTVPPLTTIFANDRYQITFLMHSPQSSTTVSLVLNGPISFYWQQQSLPSHEVTFLEPTSLLL